MNDLPRLPRWFLLLPMLAIAAWWPIAPYWQSDDFLALHYARDFGNVLHDFVGPQYGAADVWLFYRPLITLSFWFDGLVAGADPFFSHLSNVLAHGAGALLVGLLWRRFLPDGHAFLAGLIWSVMPGHVGAIAWAVGRVDSHTTVWCLLALWSFVRYCDRRELGQRAALWPALAATALALMSKESAFVLPALASVLACCRARGAVATRLLTAARRSAPLWLLFAGYLVFRWLVLGRLGGYLAASYDAATMARGLGSYLANAVAPLRWIGGDSLGALAPWLAGLALVLPIGALLLAPRRALLAALLFAVAAAPLAAFLAGADNVHNLRYLYLPSVVLAGLLAAPGRIAVALVLLAFGAPFVQVRAEQIDADRESARMHTAIRRQADGGAGDPMFVAGMPHANPGGTAVQLHFAVDRMLREPFGPGHPQLFALRPLVEAPGVFRLTPPGAAPFALPQGSTWFFAAATALGRAPAPPVLPELEIRGDLDRDLVVDLTTPRLLALATKELTIGLTTRPGRPQAFRLTIFTANGYLCCLFLDHGETGSGHGTIDLFRLLGGPPLIKAQYGVGDVLNLGDGMVVPATIDLDPTFPALLEAGELDLQRLRFTPTHVASRLLRLRYDRGYAGWVRLVQGRT